MVKEEVFRGSHMSTWAASEFTNLGLGGERLKR